MKDDSVNWGEVRAVLSSTILPKGKSVGMEPATNPAREAIKVTTDIVLDFFNKHPGIKVMGANGEVSAYFTANNVIAVANLVCNAVVRQNCTTPTAPRAEPDLRELIDLLKEAHIQIKNFYCDGSHAARGCDACLFQNEIVKKLAAYEAATKTEGGM